MNVCESKPSFQVGTLLSFEGITYERIVNSIKETLLHNQEHGQLVHAMETSEYMPITEIEIDSEKRQLRRPILLEVTQEEGVYIAENKTLNVVASGDTPDEAIADAKETVANDFRFYSKTPESKLIGLGAKLKQVYINLFD
ncbi:MAG: hypothetical protein HY550_06070 [Elusimicrobia bacterium]|nr:hypothetical protein [Elusimicrobiota bacterium]